MKAVEKDELEEEFQTWKEEQNREKAKKTVKKNLKNFEAKREEMVNRYVETINKYGPEHRVSKIYFSMLKFYEKMYTVVEELVTVQDALLSIDDLNYIMENTFKSLDVVLKSNWNKKRVSAFYRWRQSRSINKYVKNAYKRLRSAQNVGDSLVKSLDKINFTGSKDQETNVVDETQFNQDTRNLIAQAQARYNGTSEEAKKDSQAGSSQGAPMGNTGSSSSSSGLSGEAGNTDDIFKD